MSKAISLQCNFFLISVLWGAILLVMYVVLRIARCIKKHKWFTIAAEDFMFWLLAAFLIFKMMYEQNDGSLRGYAIAGVFIGMVLYDKIISKHFLKLLKHFQKYLTIRIDRCNRKKQSKR